VRRLGKDNENPSTQQWRDYLGIITDVHLTNASFDEKYLTNSRSSAKFDFHYGTPEERQLTTANAIADMEKELGVLGVAKSRPFTDVLEDFFGLEEDQPTLIKNKEKLQEIIDKQLQLLQSRIAPSFEMPTANVESQHSTEREGKKIMINGIPVPISKVVPDLWKSGSVRVSRDRETRIRQNSKKNSFSNFDLKNTQTNWLIEPDLTEFDSPDGAFPESLDYYWFMIKVHTFVLFEAKTSTGQYLFIGRIVQIRKKIGEKKFQYVTEGEFGEAVEFIPLVFEEGSSGTWNGSYKEFVNGPYIPISMI